MRVSFTFISAVALTLAIVGCGSGTPGGSATPGATLAPGTTPAPGATATPAGSTPAPTVPGGTPAPTGGVVLTGHECDAVPTFSISNPNPSFPPDTELLAHYPTTVDGQPVTDAQAYPWVYLLCLGGQATFNQTVTANPMMASLSFGQFTANVDGEDVDVFAWRQPGGDATSLAQTIAALAAAAGNPIDVGQITTSNIGGKNVYTWTDSTDGSTGYAYVSGDTMLSFSDVTDSQATKILSALP